MVFLKNRLAGSTEQMSRELRAFRYILEGRDFDMTLARYQLSVARAERRQLEQQLSRTEANKPVPLITEIKPADTITRMLDGYAGQEGSNPGTVNQFRSIINNLIAFLGHNDAKRVGHANQLAGLSTCALSDVMRGKQRGQPRSATTINESYLAAVKAVFAYGRQALQHVPLHVDAWYASTLGLQIRNPVTLPCHPPHKRSLCKRIQINAAFFLTSNMAEMLL